MKAGADRVGIGRTWGLRRAATSMVGAAVASRLILAGLQKWDVARASQTDDPWSTTNFRGRRVSLRAGHACALAAVGATALDRRIPRQVRAAAALAGTVAAVVGAYDDRVGTTGAQGVRGHAEALRAGVVTTGAAKVAAIGAAALAAGAAVADGPAARKIQAGVVIAASANLVNLFDLRPGRAAKVALAVALPLSCAGSPIAAVTAGAIGGMLPDDLRERAMLGDAGANAVGALVGVALVAGRGVVRLPIALVVTLGLTAVAEFVSFSKVIEETPMLRRLDQVGRLAS